MSEPAEYIFQEWDAMCARANNSLRGSCPLLEDEVLVEMHKYLGGLEERLAAAEAEAHAFRRQLVVISEAHPDTTARNLKVIANSILRPSK